MPKLSSGLIPPHGPSGDGVAPDQGRDAKPELSATEGAYSDAIIYLKSKLDFEEIVLAVALRRAISRKEARLIVKWASRDHEIEIVQPPEPVPEPPKPIITALPDDDPDTQDEIAKKILADNVLPADFSAQDE